MAIRWAVVPCVCAVLAGCTHGMLFTAVTEPATLEFHHTPVGSKTCTLANHRVEYNRVSVEWDASRVKDLALQVGMTNIYYADLRTVSILRGVYRKKTLIVYGD